MEVDAELQGVEEAFQSLSAFVEREERALKEAFEFILRAMVNYARNHAPFEDHTGNLRNSISCNFGTMQYYPPDTDPATLRAVASQNEQPVLDIEGDDYRGYLSVGMSYGVWVETTGGYWVIQGAIDKFEPLIERYFAEYMSVEKLDLDQEAAVEYLRQLEREAD